MTDWLLVLVLLSVAAVLTCLRFTGCLLLRLGRSSADA